MSSIKLPFGLKDGRLVGTDQVERGLACGCICPGCGSALEAHKGEKLTHHFAHHDIGNCVGALETALHLAAKQILLDDRRMVVPGLFVVGIVKDSVTGLEARARRSTDSREIEFSEAHAEWNLGGVVADVLAWYKGKPLVLEVAVTHFSKNEKKARLAKMGIAAVEIDLSKVKMPVTMSDIRQLVVSAVDNKTWLFNPKLSALQAAADAEAQVMMEQMLVKAGADLERRNAQLAKKQAEEARRKALAAIRADQEAAWHRGFKEGDSAKKLELALSRLGIVDAVIPAYLNFSTRGDKAFPVERRVWQAGIFAAIIHSNEKYSETSVEEVVEWAADNFLLREPYPNAVKVAAWDFLANLEKMHCLIRSFGQGFYIQFNRVREVNAAIAQDSSLVGSKQEPLLGKASRLRLAWALQPRNPIWSDVRREDYAHTAIEECRKKFGSHPAWKSLLTSLDSSAYEIPPAEFVVRYGNAVGLAATNVLRALILAGFVIEGDASMLKR